MKARYIFIFFFLITLRFVSQTKVYTSISHKVKPEPAKELTFEKVIDARTTKNSIGIVHTINDRSDYLADFSKPLSQELYNFFTVAYPNQYSANKIITVVNYFEIGHIITGSKTDTGFVTADIDFYIRRNDSSFKILHFNSKLTEAKELVAVTHSERMKALLVKAAAQLDSTLIMGKSLTQLTPNNSPLLSDSLRNLSSNYPFVTQKNGEYIVPESPMTPRETIVAIGGHALFSSSVNMFGGNLNVLFRIKNHVKLLVGFNINYSIIKFKDQTIIPSNTEYQIKTSDFGLKLLWQIKGPVFYSLNPHMMIGKETISSLKVSGSSYTGYTVSKTSTTENLFLGLQIDNGVLFIHPKIPGAFFGADFNLRFTNSSVFDSDFGVKFSAGFAF